MRERPTIDVWTINDAQQPRISAEQQLPQVKGGDDDDDDDSEVTKEKTKKGTCSNDDEGLKYNFLLNLRLSLCKLQQCRALPKPNTNQLDDNLITSL